MATIKTELSPLFKNSNFPWKKTILPPLFVTEPTTTPSKLTFIIVEGGMAKLPQLY